MHDKTKKECSRLQFCVLCVRDHDRDGLFSFTMTYVHLRDGWYIVLYLLLTLNCLI
jgi:hypothetical protein